MSKAHQDIEKAIRRELSEHFPKTIFKLSTFKPTLAGTVQRGQYRVHGQTLYVEFFVEHLQEKGIAESQVRAVIENMLNSPENETDVSRILFKRKNVPVKISNLRLHQMKADVAELIEADEENQEIILQTMEVLARSLSRNDSEMVINFLADYNEEKI